MFYVCAQSNVHVEAEQYSEIQFLAETYEVVNSIFHEIASASRQTPVTSKRVSV